MRWRAGNGYITRRVPSSGTSLLSYTPFLPISLSLSLSRCLSASHSRALAVATTTTRTLAVVILSYLDSKETERKVQRKDGRRGGRVKPAFLRPAANFIPNLRNGRANELLNYSVASRKVGGKGRMGKVEGEGRHRG